MSVLIQQTAQLHLGFSRLLWGVWWKWEARWRTLPCRFNSDLLNSSRFVNPYYQEWLWSVCCCLPLSIPIADTPYVSAHWDLVLLLDCIYNLFDQYYKSCFFPLLNSNKIFQTCMFQALWWNWSGKICVSLETDVEDTCLCQWALRISCSCPLPYYLDWMQGVTIAERRQVVRDLSHKTFYIWDLPSRLVSAKIWHSGVCFHAKICSIWPWMPTSILFQHMRRSGSSGQTCVIL